MINVLNQPSDGAIGYELESLLADNVQKKFKNFYMLVAYARRSGVGRLSPFMKKFRDAGGIIKAVIGLDSQNTSVEALEELLTISDELFVFHNEAFARTYHPKLYLFESPSKHAWVSVGSSNLTGGGLYANYEVNALYTLNLDIRQEIESFQDILKVFNSYRDTQSGLCKKVNLELIQTLQQEGYIQKEENLRKSLIKKKRNQSAEQRRKIFAYESEPPSRSMTPEADTRGIIMRATGTNTGFWKKLSKFDVSPTSAPGQLIIPKQFLDMFPPMDEPIITKSGAEQSDVFFNVIFENHNGDRLQINNVRAIFYIPAPTHKRPNSELRFTFRKQEILNNLASGNILEFRRSDEPSIWFLIRQIDFSSSEYMHIKKGKSFGFI